MGEVPLAHNTWGVSYEGFLLQIVHVREKQQGEDQHDGQGGLGCCPVPVCLEKERIFLEFMTSDRKLKACGEGSPCRSCFL